MAERHWAAKLLGNILIAAGACIAWLPGMCTGIVVIAEIASGGRLATMAEPLGAMGFPLALGALAMLIGRVLTGFTPVRAFGFAGAVLGILICAAAVYLAAVEPRLGPPIGMFGLSWTEAGLGFDLLAGVALLGVSVWELRRR